MASDHGKATTDGEPADEGLENASAPKPVDATGQHGAYWILSEEERAKEFVRPYRTKYKHLKCGTITSMGKTLSETYARKPSFYGATFCFECKDHFPVGEAGEFVWDRTEEKVGT